MARDLADGEARQWDRSGQLVSETSFESGEMKGRGRGRGVSGLRAGASHFIPSVPNEGH